MAPRRVQWQFDTVTLARRCGPGASTPSPNLANSEPTATTLLRGKSGRRLMLLPMGELRERLRRQTDASPDRRAMDIYPNVTSLVRCQSFKAVSAPILAADSMMNNE
jgi:hypothetical protein